MSAKVQDATVSTSNGEIVTVEKSQLSDLWKKEDWLAIWIGAILIVIATIGVLSGAFDFSAAKFATWGNGTSPFEQLSTGEFWIKLIRTFVVTGVLFTAGVKLKGQKVKEYIPAYIGLFILAVLVRLLIKFLISIKTGRSFLHLQALDLIPISRKSRNSSRAESLWYFM